MNLINFIVWFSTGAAISWFASRIVMVEQRQTPKPLPVEDLSSEKS